MNLDGSNADAPHARPRGLDGLSLRERRRWVRRRWWRGGRGGGARARRRAQLDGEGRTIDTSKPLDALGDRRVQQEERLRARSTIGQPAQRLVWLDKQVSGLRKAKNADVYLLEEQTYEESPNYFVAGAVARRREARVAHERVPERLRVGQAGADELHATSAATSCR